MKYLLLLICAMILLAAAPAYSKEEVTTQATMPSRALQGWEKLQGGLTGVGGKFRHISSISDGSTTTTQIDQILEFGTTRDGVFLKDDTNGLIGIAAANSQYAFQANRPIKDKEFELDLYRTNKQAIGVRKRVCDYFEPFLFAGFEISGKTMPAFAASQEFSLVSLEEDTDRKTATATFKYGSPKSSPDTAVTGGTVTFATDKYWAIESFNCTTVWGRMEGTVKYREFNGMPIPAVYETRSYPTSDSKVGNTRYELLEIAELQRGKEPIYLENYGLMAPPPKIGVQQSGSRIWFWVCSVIVLGIAAYIALRRR